MPATSTHSATTSGCATTRGRRRPWGCVDVPPFKGLPMQQTDFRVRAGIMRARISTSVASALLCRVRRRLADETGMSLILALGFLTIFSISTAAIVNELVLNQAAAPRDQKMVSALSSAEAEMNYGEQWVEANDPNNLVAAGTYYPTQSSGVNRAQVASTDSVSSTMWFYTGNPIVGATNTGWWAHKLDAATCNATYEITGGFKCWVVDGHAKIGLSSREVQVGVAANNPGSSTAVAA